MENFDLLSALVSILIKIAISYVVLGLFTLTAVEAISTVLKLRSKYLKTILKRNFNDDNLVEAFYNHPLIKILGNNTNYIDRDIFSYALLDILKIDNAQNFLIDCQEKEHKYYKNYFVQALYSLSKSATSVEEIRSKAEFLFIDLVNKISNGYKFKIQKIIFIIATILVVSLNIDSIKLFKSITTTTLAQNITSALKEDKSLPDSTRNILSNLSSNAYPVGWINESFPTFLSVITKLAGWFITIIFTCFSAQFLYSRYIATGKANSKH